MWWYFYNSSFYSFNLIPLPFSSYFLMLLFLWSLLFPLFSSSVSIFTFASRNLSVLTVFQTTVITISLIVCSLVLLSSLYIFYGVVLVPSGSWNFFYTFSFWLLFCWVKLELFWEIWYSIKWRCLATVSEKMSLQVVVWERQTLNDMWLFWYLKYKFVIYKTIWGLENKFIY